MSKLEYRFGGPGEKTAAPKPIHKVVETQDGFIIDGFELDYVLTGGVTAQQLSEDVVKINVSFLAKSYDYKFKEQHDVDKILDSVDVNFAQKMD